MREFFVFEAKVGDVKLKYFARIDSARECRFRVSAGGGGLLLRLSGLLLRLALGLVRE